MKTYIVEVSFKAYYNADSEEEAKDMVDDDCRLGECFAVSIDAKLGDALSESSEVKVLKEHGKILIKKHQECIDEWIRYDGGESINAKRNIKFHKKCMKEIHDVSGGISE